MVDTASHSPGIKGPAAKTKKAMSGALIAVAFIFAAIFLWLVYQTALSKEVEFWGKAFILGGFVLSVVAAILTTYDSKDGSIWANLFTPKGAMILLAAIFVGSGTMADMVGMFEPRNATTRDTDAISAQVDEVAQILERRFPESPPILEEIEGRWGEQDTCALVWDISIVKEGTDAALVADLVVRPPGVDNFRLLASISKAEDYELEVIGEEPQQARGRAASFALNPATQRLEWDDKSSAGGVEEYVRCPQS